MDNRPIGFFDSGIGGLTSVMALHKELPLEHVIFYGDTARTPYGSKSPETIREFSRQIVNYLVSKDVKMVIIACNTVTAMALPMLRELHPELPILGVVEPTAKRVAEDGCSKVGIIGTKVTINSNVYPDTIHRYDPGVETCSLACPAFVPLVEEGIIDNQIMDLTIRYYMDDFVSENHIDKLVLGCTHYPLIAHRIKKLYPQMEFYSSSEEVIKEAKVILEERDALAEENDMPDRYYASDLSDNFMRMTDALTGRKDARIKLKKLEY